VEKITTFFFSIKYQFCGEIKQQLYVKSECWKNKFLLLVLKKQTKLTISSEYRIFCAVERQIFVFTDQQKFWVLRTTGPKKSRRIQVLTERMKTNNILC
jgi:hypothetical protein